MYFALEPEPLPKSTWQMGQATEGMEEERRTGGGWETGAEGSIDGTGMRGGLAGER